MRGVWAWCSVFDTELQGLLWWVTLWQTGNTVQEVLCC